MTAYNLTVTLAFVSGFSLYLFVAGLIARQVERWWRWYRIFRGKRVKRIELP